MRSFLTHLLLLLLFLPICYAQSQLYFPPTTGTTWDTVSPTSLGWCDNEIDSLYDYLEVNNTKAFMVLKDGKIVLEKYFGTFTQDSAWYWASTGKTLTAFLVGVAQQEGHLSIHDTTSKFLGTGWTNAPPAKEEKITIRHQLTMTSGLDDGVTDPYCTIDTCLQYLSDAGSRWAYHNAPYTLLDEVMENATGQTLNAYTYQKLTGTTGITGAFFKIGYNNVFLSKPRSMARFGLLMLNKGSWNGTSILTDTAYFNQMVNTSQPLNLGYGYLWWLNGKSSFMAPGGQFVFSGSIIPSAPADMISALGKNGQVLNVVPSQNLVVVRMGDAPGSGEVPIFFTDTVWQKLNEVICTGALVKESSQLQPSIYPNPAGDYFQITADTEFSIIVTSLDGKIMISASNLQGTTKIICSDWPAGMYVVKIKDSRGTRVVRVLHTSF